MLRKTRRSSTWAGSSATRRTLEGAPGGSRAGPCWSCLPSSRPQRWTWRCTTSATPTCACRRRPGVEFERARGCAQFRHPDPVEIPWACTRAARPAIARPGRDPIELAPGRPARRTELPGRAGERKAEVRAAVDVERSAGQERAFVGDEEERRGDDRPRWRSGRAGCSGPSPPRSPGRRRRGAPSSRDPLAHRRRRAADRADAVDRRPVSGEPTARDSVSPIRPNFEEQYACSHAKPRRPASDEIVTIRPPARREVPAAACDEERTLRLTSSVRIPSARDLVERLDAGRPPRRRGCEPAERARRLVERSANPFRRAMSARTVAAPGSVPPVAVVVVHVDERNAGTGGVERLRRRTRSPRRTQLAPPSAASHRHDAIASLETKPRGGSQPRSPASTRLAQRPSRTTACAIAGRHAARVETDDGVVGWGGSRSGRSRRSRQGSPRPRPLLQGADATSVRAVGSRCADTRSGRNGGIVSFRSRPSTSRLTSPARPRGLPARAARGSPRPLPRVPR
jgi:hypothetical protein